MSFKTRFILLAIFNSFLLVGFLYILSQNGIAFNERLVDLDLEMIADRNILVALIGGLLLALVVNTLILASRKNEFSYDQIRAITVALKR